MELPDAILKTIPLNQRLSVLIQMMDYAKWNNGEYKGDTAKNEELATALEAEVISWINDGMYGFKQKPNKK